MQAMDDMALLEEYATRNSEAAFAELVSRRIGLVYSAALRQVRDPHLAEEVTQAVFIILALKAGKISDKTNLIGWFFRTTRFAALAQIRAAAKRRQREQEAQMQSEFQPSVSDLFWEQMSPLLDEALAALGEKDRQAVLLRFFENKSLAEVGNCLGTCEDTARKRVSRALEKLRRYFSKRGVASTTAIIAGTISDNSVQAAPVALTKSVAAVAIAKGSIVTASILTLVKGTLKIMTWTKLKFAFGIAAAMLLAGGAVTVAISDGNDNVSQPTTNGPRAKARSVLVVTRFVTVPEGALKNLDSEWLRTNTLDGATVLLSQSSFNTLNRKLQQTSGVELFAAPRIGGLSGEKASMSVTKAVELDGSFTNIGVSIEVTPDVFPNSPSVIELNLTAELSELIDAPPQQNGSQRKVQTTKAMASARLIQGETLLIQRAIRGGEVFGRKLEGPTSLLIFVTPSLPTDKELQAMFKKGGTNASP